MFSLRIASLRRAMINIQFRPFSPVQSQLAFVQSKNLFSDAFHLVDITEKDIFKVKAVTKDSLAFKDEIRSSFNKSEKTKTNDLVKFLLLSEGEKDLNFALALLNRAISENLRILGYSEKTFDLIWLYLRVCYIQNLPLQATQAWNDPVIRSTNYAQDRARLSRLYFDLLFNNNMFQDVLDTFNRDFARLVSKFDCVKLTCLACYKLNTTAALKEGLQILAHPSCVIDTPSNRSYQALALLAYNLKEFNIAYDLLAKYGSTNMNDRKKRDDPMFPRALMLMVLADLGWLEEAIMLLETSGSRYDRKKKFSYFAVEKVLEAAQNSGNNQAVRKIKNMNLLPYHAGLVFEDGLEQMLMKEIKTSFRHKKSPPTPFTFSI